LTKRHTRHSRRGFYPPKKDHSTLPGVLYVASDGPEVEQVLVSEDECEVCAFLKAQRGNLNADDNTLVNDANLLMVGEKISTEVGGKVCGKGVF